MYLSDLPTAVQTFLKATEKHDAEALFGSLANDAVLIDNGKEHRGPAIRKWNEKLYLGAKVRVHPIHVEDREGEVALSVTLDGDYATYGVTEPSQFDWLIKLRDGRISSLNMIERPLSDLPKTVASFVNSMNMYDLDRTLATFAQDANVNDNRRDFWGRSEVREWLAREIIGEKVTMFVTESRVHTGRCFVVARVTGAYDKTGLPDPLTLRFYFCLDEAGLISQLIIIPSKTA
jgi:ketosteroid isomerase-like protein